MTLQSSTAPERRSSAGTFCDVNGAAKILDVSASFLNERRLDGDGPPYVKFGKIVRYDVVALLAWAADRTRRSTSEVAA
jgi:hypothetical protein